MPIVLPNPYTNLTYVPNVLGMSGGGTFTLTPTIPPAGITERAVIVLDGTAGSGSVAFMDTIVEASGGTAVVPNMIGSPGSPTIAFGGNRAYCVGADFPWIELGQPNNTAQSPSLGNGSDGTSNLSVSSQFSITQ